MTTTTEEVLQLVADERQRQHAKWGEQNHPGVDKIDVATFHEARRRTSAATPAAFAEHIALTHSIPTAADARDRCQRYAAAGLATWSRILLEEFAEAIEAAALFAIGHGTAEQLRTELVQVAAVAVQWAEKLGGAE
ncbi:Uncharacterised protein [Mycobacteroides abscessus subsp. abscessus]|uniref:hypothetical protein n=1 Tax=Mycobacteroides abscessus TaxID=36809 RepID=UPI00092B8E43|nr:hypothetical protein [Mycobacteroides abscessus]MDO3312367.1 hypothetical protein [Mycobacteroides abscessus subsp. abscessus]MDO3344951.1 hypothetical protein [Mycobacteroides abscessus subsp. abscessus]SHP10225.1 Uncharacterised protein [Mycobacteroides abscessus subsp. abscessus]SHP24138.1 Uncharacterised protein [Mycobacteroides abscessus subsp. abscessus]SHP95053.1 Uncharacterised protein [Mycobacteroides abscessus subsp. abscessus]